MLPTQGKSSKVILVNQKGLQGKQDCKLIRSQSSSVYFLTLDKLCTTFDRLIPFYLREDNTWINFWKLMTILRKERRGEGRRKEKRTDKRKRKSGIKEKDRRGEIWVLKVMRYNSICMIYMQWYIYMRQCINDKEIWIVSSLEIETKTSSLALWPRNWSKFWSHSHLELLYR